MAFLVQGKPTQDRWWLNWLLAAASLGLFIGLSELTLRAVGFEHGRIPNQMQSRFVDGYIEWQNNNIVHQHFQMHPTRFWSGVPNVGNINRDGYQGAALPVDRTENTLRILFLGDSCTNAGDDHYPHLVIEGLRRQGIPGEALIAAIGGYSTLQGLRFYEESLRYQPDIVVAYFGWNDHWLASAGRPDNLLDELSQTDRWVHRTVGKLRLFQLMLFLAHPAQHKPSKGVGLEEIASYVRVPPPFYQANVQAMIDLAGAHGTPIFFISPPLGRHIVDADLDVNFPPQHIPLIHGYYRKLLKETVRGEPMAQLVTFDDIDFDDQLMWTDGIHPRAAGFSVIANRLTAAIIERLAEVDGAKGT